MTAVSWTTTQLEAYADGRSSFADLVGLAPAELARIVALGVSCLAAGDVARAGRVFAAVVSIEPRLPHGHVYGGLVAERAGRFDEAATAFDRASALLEGRASADAKTMLDEVKRLQLRLRGERR